MNKIVVVSRHAGAIDFVKKTMNYDGDVVFANHIDNEMISSLKSGDVVVGVFPMHIAAELNKNGVRTFSIVMNIPADMRGKELTADTMVRLGAKIEEVVVLTGDSLAAVRSGWDAIISDTGQPYAPLHPLLKA